MTDANNCPICGKSKTADPAAPGAHCLGHAEGNSMKAALDAIKTPGSGAAPAAASAQPAKSAPPPVPAPKPASSQQNMKSALDAIPTPGASKGAPPAQPAPTNTKPAEPNLRDQLDSIPTPGAKAGASITNSQLDAIPTPVSRPGDTSAGGSFADQLNAIPTPGMSRPASASANSLDAIPTPRPGGAPPPPPAEQPQWMKNYNSHKAAISASSASGFPVQNPNDSYQMQNRDMPATGSGGYTMIAVLVVVIVIAFFGFAMMNKTAPVNLDGTTTGTTGTPSTTSTPVPGQSFPQPVQPSQPVISQPVGSGAPPATEPSVVMP